MEEIRSFIAIELPGEIKLALARIQERLRPGGGGQVKWVDPESMHLTLKFLGNIDSGLTGRITASLEEACREIHPFFLEIDGLGVFPNARRVRVVWVGLTGDTGNLIQLQKRVDEVLAPLGFEAEARPFTPHLTLARVREQAGPDERLSIGRLVESAVMEGGRLSVNALHLMRSQLMRSGPIYTRISSVALK